MLTTVISGGQTGADQAGLRAAKILGYRTGGMMPLGYRTEDGPRPDLAIEFGLDMSRFEGYEHRTRHNIRVSDATIIFSLGSLDGGSYLTSASAQAQGKPLMVITEWYAEVGFRPLPAAVRRFLMDRQIGVVNIAGNRESKSPGIGGWVEAYLLEVLKQQ
jgi:hypothetical protein